MNITKEQFYIDELNVVRWKSNDCVPPVDCLDKMYYEGLINDSQYFKSREIGDSETQQFIRNYKMQMERHVPSQEEIQEMKKEFGEGTTVMNVITGKKVTL